MSVLEPKMTHLSNFEHSKNFLQKTDSATFTCLLSPRFMQKIEKNRRAHRHAETMEVKGSFG